MPMLSWNPRAGYSCTGCDWTRHVHIGPALPGEDEILAQVRKEFAEHLLERHSNRRRSNNRQQDDKNADVETDNVVEIRFQPTRER